MFDSEILVVFCPSKSCTGSHTCRISQIHVPVISRCVAHTEIHGESQVRRNLSRPRCDWSSGTEGGSQAGQRPIGPTLGKMAPSDVLCLWWAVEKGVGRSSVGRGRGVHGEGWLGAGIGEVRDRAIFGPHMTHIPPGFRWVRCNRFLFPFVRGCGEVGVRLALRVLRNTAVNSTTASSVQVCQFASSISPLQKKAEKKYTGIDWIETWSQS